MAQEKIFQQLQQVFSKGKQQPPMNMRMKNPGLSSASIMSAAQSSTIPVSLQQSISSAKGKSIFNKQPTMKIRPKDRRYQQRTAQPSLLQSEENAY